MTPQKFCLHEGTACASYIMRQGVPAARLLKESASYDTIGNAYFAAAIHALPATWTTLAVVTSEFHMPRSRLIFESLFRLAAESRGRGFDLHFYSVSDNGVFEADVLEARLAREAESLARFEADIATIQSLAAFHAWLHDTHLCYAVSRQHEWGAPTRVDDRALASY